MNDQPRDWAGILATTARQIHLSSWQDKTWSNALPNLRCVALRTRPLIRLANGIEGYLFNRETFHTMN